MVPGSSRSNYREQQREIYSTDEAIAKWNFNVWVNKQRTMFNAKILSIVENTKKSKNTKDSMCKSFRVVLNLPYNDERFSDIQSYFHFVLTTLSNANDFFYWGIVHELDKVENGDFKTPHIHIVLKLVNMHILLVETMYIQET